MTSRNLEALFHPRHAWFLGAPVGASQSSLLERLRSNRGLDFRQVEAPPLPETDAPRDGLLAIVAGARFSQADTMSWLATHGCRAVLWPLAETPSREVLRVAGSHAIRVLGPRSVGLALPSANLDLSCFAEPPLPGSLAMIMQSQSVAAAATDWANGRRIGFSWVAVTGGEADVDVADLLDHAAMDPNTRAVAVELGRIRGARKFMSAARACARSKPTVILQTRPDEGDAAGADAVRSAAFARAGLVEVPSLPALFDAIAALQRLPEMNDRRVLVAANGAAVASLAMDAVLRQGLRAMELPAPLRQEIQEGVPGARFPGGAIDLGDLSPESLVATLRRLDAKAAYDAMILVRSPLAGQTHEAHARALAESGLSNRVLTVWLGLQQAAAARSLSSATGGSTFTSPDAAARAIRYRYEYARNRELLTATPPAHAVPTVDVGATAARLRALASASRSLRAREVHHLLETYGIASTRRPSAGALVLSVQAFRHPELGMNLRVQTAARGTAPAEAFACPPLDPLLSARVLDAAGATAGNGISDADRAAARDALIRVSQLVMDLPAILRLEACLATCDGRAAMLEDGVITLDADPVPERERLALAPYPAWLEHDMWLRDGRQVHVRPVRPSDEPALVRLLESLAPEAARLRFFCSIRHFSHAMAGRMTQIDYDRELALAAFPAGNATEMAGMATLICDPEGVGAEFALEVGGDFGGAGLGSHLLERLIEHGRSRSIRTIYGDVLMENGPMLAVARRLGFSARPHPEEDGCFRVELAIA